MRILFLFLKRLYAILSFCLNYVFILFICFRSINKEIISSIIQFCEDSSQEAGNKTVKFEGKVVPVKFLSKPYSHLHQDFCDKYPEKKISLSSFRKYIPKYFQRGGGKRTDMCSYCVEGEKSLQHMKRIEELYRHNSELSAEIERKIEKIIFCPSFFFFFSPEFLTYPYFSLILT